jgi:hypothetical protein
MAAAEVDVATAVVTAINGNGSIGLTASRAYIVEADALKSTTTQCRVMILSEAEERDSRATSREVIEIGVVVFQKLDAPFDSAIDGLLDKLRLIRKLMLGQTLSGYRVRSVSSDPLYDEVILRRMSVFAGYVTITCDAIVSN